jgi:phosphonate ABC transporter permease subunit PhnE
MALMASTLGTILAVPISFLGARNLMAGVGAPLASIMAALIALPIGGFIGWLPTTLIVDLSESLVAQPVMALAALLLSLAFIVVLLRLGPSLVSDAENQSGSRIGRWLRLVLVILLSVLGLALLAQLGLIAGEWLSIKLSVVTFLGIDFFGFIGVFIEVIAGLVIILLPALIGFVTALVAASFASRYGQEAVLNMAEGPARFITALLTTIGTAILVFGIAYAINWICLLGICERLPDDTFQLVLTLAVPSLIIGLIAALFSFRAKPKRQYPIGMVTYTVTRTILNTLRAIEPLIMGFVLVIWLGIGPFAGVLALMLHSIADLGKLFSEQVENIDEGPVEAVTATGAGGLQKVVFAVVPQVVPHYTAFIFYRWDINVRLSTIIGFVGGGGIGLILFRSTNLTQYRQASVMVISIALVVTVLDYVSSRIRKRII